VAKIKVLFVCSENTTRSQMAQAWLTHLCGDRFEAHSAGIHPGKEVHPFAVRVMKEVGIDLSAHRTQSVFDVYKSGAVFNYIITVCDQASAEKCPVFLGLVRQIHWDVPDPSDHGGSDQEELQAMREMRDAMRDSIEQWCLQSKDSLNHTP